MERIRGRRGRRRSLIRVGAAVFAVLAVVAVLAFLLGPVTSWAGGAAVRHLSGKDKADAINGVRQTLLQAAAGAVALTVLVFTGLTFTLNRRGQVTDRYAKAIGLLASEKPDERVGGVYALEHIMVESERDHETVVQVLAAFVREHAKVDAARPVLWIDPPPPARDGRSHHEREPMTDVQIALTVLGRRPARDERQGLDLRRTDLRGMDLVGARLERANLDGARLQRVNLRGARLERANLYGARLERADLRQARLQRADLSQAHLEDADLSWAHLQDAELVGAHLERAVLSGAYLGHGRLDFSGAHLERANLRQAHLEDADLRGAHLQDADLRGAHLERADLGEAYLQGAYLREAHLEDADLSGARLDGAYLYEAHLDGADLSGIADLSQAQIEDAHANSQTRLPVHLRPEQGS